MPMRVRLDDVESGAVLAADMLDARGNVLLARGTVLTAAHLALARRRGIAEAQIEDQAVQEAAPPAVADPGDSERIEAMLRKQEAVFSQVMDRPLMAAIYAAAREHLRAGNLPPT